MAAARNGHAADDGASNLWLCSSGSLRVTFVVRRRRAGRHQRECKHNGRNNGYDCFHRDLSCKAMPAILLLSVKSPPAQWVQCILYFLSRVVGAFADMEASKFVC